jgi:putative phosphoribosyl transferase
MGLAWQNENMGTLFEDRHLRDRTGVFEGRNDAGRLLAKRMEKYAGAEGIVLGIPSGGVPIAAAIARHLKMPWDIVIVRKIQFPDDPEAGFGAVGPEGVVVYKQDMLPYLELSDEQIHEQTRKAKENVQRRDESFRKGRAFPELEGKLVILADDGLATGSTMLGAIAFVKKHHPKRIVVAVPTGSERTVQMMKEEVDEVYCLNVRSGPVFAVAEAYQEWYDMGEEDVMSILRGIT